MEGNVKLRGLKWQGGTTHTSYRTDTTTSDTVKPFNTFNMVNYTMYTNKMYVKCTLKNEVQGFVLKYLHTH